MNVLEEADKIINGERREQYGDPGACFGGIAQMWSAYKGVEFTAVDVAQMMILLKVHRNRDIWKRDSLVDVIGYAALAERLHDPSTTAVLQPDGFTNIRSDLGRVYFKLADVPDEFNFDHHGPFYERNPLA